MEHTKGEPQLNKQENCCDNNEHDKKSKEVSKHPDDKDDLDYAGHDHNDNDDHDHGGSAGEEPVWKTHWPSCHLWQYYK